MLPLIFYSLLLVLYGNCQHLLQDSLSCRQVATQLTSILRESIQDELKAFPYLPHRCSTN